jgi:hypothetical protein
MNKIITMLFLCLTSTIFAQKINSLSLGGLRFSWGAPTITKWDSCSIFTGDSLRFTGGYIMNAPVTMPLFVTSKTRSIYPNEYHDLSLQTPSTIHNFRTVAKSYKITRTKIAAWSLCAAGGVADGLLEGYLHDGRTSFERKWNANKTGFFGSESWRMVYKLGDPEKGFKTPLHGWLGASDFYHLTDDTRKIGYLTGGITLGIGGAKVNQKWWHYAVDFGASLTISALSKSAAYYYIRN